MPIDNVKFKLGTDDDATHHHDLSHYFIDYDQPINRKTGYPSGVTSLTQCLVKFEIPLDISIEELLTWQTQQNQTEDIIIEFYDNNQLVKTYSLEETYLVSLEQVLTRNNENALVQQITLHLSPLSIEMDDHLFQQ